MHVSQSCDSNLLSSIVIGAALISALISEFIKFMNSVQLFIIAVHKHAMHLVLKGSVALAPHEEAHVAHRGDIATELHSLPSHRRAEGPETAGAFPRAVRRVAHVEQNACSAKGVDHAQQVKGARFPSGSQIEDEPLVPGHHFHALAAWHEPEGAFVAIDSTFGPVAFELVAGVDGGRSDDVEPIVAALTDRSCTS